MTTGQRLGTVDIEKATLGQIIRSFYFSNFNSVCLSSVEGENVFFKLRNRPIGISVSLNTANQNALTIFVKLASQLAEFCEAINISFTLSTSQRTLYRI